MRSFYMVLLIAVCLSIVISCKKSSDSTALAGKWQETELNVYVDSSGIKTLDSTYLSSFSASDYVQFNSNGTCNLSAGHEFLTDGSGYPTIPKAIPPSVTNVNYSAYRTQYILLIPELLNYGGISQGDTVSILAPNRLLIHSVTHSGFSRIFQVDDSYYQK